MPSIMKPPSHTRNITPAEIRYLRKTRSGLLKNSDLNWRRTLLANGAVCGSLMALTWLVTDDVPGWLVVSIWGGIAAVLLVWAFLENRLAHGRLRRRARLYDEALAAGQCVDLPIRSTRVWEFEEIEDEGAVYAFELETGGVVFVAGQDFYADGRFPNSDFSLVEFQAADGSPLDLLVVKRGTKMDRERLIRASEYNMGELPGHLDFCAGTLEEVCARFIRQP
jgi:hypothetical protein